MGLGGIASANLGNSTIWALASSALANTLWSDLCQPAAAFRLGLVGINERELLSIVELAMLNNDREYTRSAAPGHLLTGITSSNAIDDLPLWSRDPVFSHMDFVRLKSKKLAGSDIQTSQMEESQLPLSEQLSLASTEGESHKVILGAVQQKLARSLQMAVEDIDCGKIVSTYGVDSLIAVEVRNWILKEFKAQIPVFQIVQAQYLQSLAEKIAAKSPFMKKTTAEKQ